jgi:hypothetical protein
VKPDLNRAWILLTITLALPLALVILVLVSRLSGSPDVIFSLILFSTVSFYVSLAAGLLVPMCIAVAWLFGGSVSRRTMVLVVVLSILNIAAAISWIRLVIPQLHLRY